MKQSTYDRQPSNNSKPCGSKAEQISPKNGGDYLPSSTTEYRRQFVVNMTREGNIEVCFSDLVILNLYFQLGMLMLNTAGGKTTFFRLV